MVLFTYILFKINQWFAKPFILSLFATWSVQLHMLTVFLLMNTLFVYICFDITPFATVFPAFLCPHYFIIGWVFLPKLFNSPGKETCEVYCQSLAFNFLVFVCTSTSLVLLTFSFMAYISAYWYVSVSHQDSIKRHGDADYLLHT